jgi:hypothetical protein
MDHPGLLLRRQFLEPRHEPLHDNERVAGADGEFIQSGHEQLVLRQNTLRLDGVKRLHTQLCQRHPAWGP